jgi:hypothetical protein
LPNFEKKSPQRRLKKKEEEISKKERWQNGGEQGERARDETKTKGYVCWLWQHIFFKSVSAPGRDWWSNVQISTIIKEKHNLRWHSSRNKGEKKSCVTFKWKFRAWHFLKREFGVCITRTFALRRQFYLFSLHFALYTFFCVWPNLK